MKITSVLLVERIEKSLAFWVDRMGWRKVVEVPADDGLGFVILSRENAELMLQTFESARQDEPRFAGPPSSHRTSLFIEVNDWPEILTLLQGYEIAMPERTTFYGKREIGVFEPSGHIVIFAAPLPKAETEKPFGTF